MNKEHNAQNNENGVNWKDMTPEELLGAILKNEDLIDEFKHLLQKRQEEKIIEEEKGKNKKSKRNSEVSENSGNTLDKDRTLQVGSADGGDGLLFFCGSEAAANKKLKELKAKYPDKEFEITEVDKKQFQEMRQNRLRERIKKEMQVQNNKIADDIIEGLRNEGQVKLKNFPTKDNTTGEVRHLKEATLKLKRDKETKRLHIKIEYNIIPNKPDDIYVSATGDENSQEVPKVEIVKSSPIEKTRNVLDENKTPSGTINQENIKQESGQKKANEQAEQALENKEKQSKKIKR